MTAFDQNLIAPRIMANVERLYATMRIRPEFLMGAKVEGQMDYLSDEMVYSFAMQVIATEITSELEKTTSRNEKEQVELRPLTTWDAIKRSLILWLPVYPNTQRKLLDRWVKMERIVVKQVTQHIDHYIKHFHVNPMPPGLKDSAYATFMSWNKPFVGSRAEYLALRDIADMLDRVYLDGIGPDSNPALSKAVWDYRKAKLANEVV